MRSRRHGHVARLYPRDDLTYLYLEDDMHTLEGQKVDDEIWALAQRCQAEGFTIKATSTGLQFYPADKAIAPVPVSTRSGHGRGIKNITAALMRAGMSDPTGKKTDGEAVERLEVTGPDGEAVTVGMVKAGAIAEVLSGVNERFEGVEPEMVSMMMSAYGRLLLDDESDPLDTLLTAMSALAIAAGQRWVHHREAVGAAGMERLAELEQRLPVLQRDVDEAMEMVARAEAARDAMKAERDQLVTDSDLLRLEIRDLKRRNRAVADALKGLTE